MRYLLLVVCILSHLSYAEVYKTVDKDGNVKYTDSPPNDQAQTLELPEINTVPPEEARQGYSEPQTQDQSVTYDVEILSPRNEVLIPPGERDLAVAIALSPGLQADHLITYYIDDQLVEETTSSSIVIQNPPRGGRTLRVEVIDQSGEVLGESEPLTITIIRPNVRKK